MDKEIEFIDCLENIEIHVKLINEDKIHIDAEGVK
jgi:hypothetical protein